MPLRKVKATDIERLPKFFEHKHVAPPLVKIWWDGRARWNAMSTALLGITRIWTAETATRLAPALAPIPADETYEWTQQDVRKILDALDSVPLPEHVQIDRLRLTQTATVRAVLPNTPDAVELNYGKSKYPSHSLLAAVRQWGQVIPEGMVLEVPASLLELDNGGVAVALPLHKGVLKSVGDAEEPEAGGESDEA